MIYSILLSSTNGNKPRAELVSGTSYTSTQEVYWTINWDDLFQTRNKQFKNCKVKYQFILNTLEDGVTAGQLYSVSNRFFYLSASLATDSQGSSKSAQNTNQITGTLLGLLDRTTIPTYNGGGSLLYFNNIFGNNLATEGINALTPQGTSNFYVYLSPFQTAGNVFTQDYTLELQFFFDEDE